MRAGVSRIALRTGAWAAVGVIGLGAAAGVAAATGGSSGAPSAAPGTATVAAANTAASAAPHGRARHRLGLLQRAVHATAVVRTRHGFLTVAFQRGIVQSVSGNTVTIVSPSPDHFTATYTVGTQSKVMKDRRPVTLSSVHVGDHVGVIATQSGSGWTVRRLMDWGNAPGRARSAGGSTA